MTDLENYSFCNCLKKCDCEANFRNVFSAIHKFGGNPSLEENSVKKSIKVMKSEGSKSEGTKEEKKGKKKPEKEYKEIIIREKSPSLVSKDGLDFKKLVDKIIGEIFKLDNFKEILFKYPHNETLPTVIKNIIRSNNFVFGSEQKSLTPKIIDDLILHITADIFPQYNKKCFMDSSIIKLAEMDIETMFNKFVGRSMLSYSRIITDALVRQSRNYVDINKRDDTDFLSDYRNTIYMGNGKNLVHPVVMALFGPKLPMLEELAVYSDSYEVLTLFKKVLTKSLTPDDYDTYMLNSFLINKRIDIPQPFIPDIDPITSEIQRIIIHSLLKICIFKLRSGVFNDDKFTLFDSIVQNIYLYYPNYTSTAKGMLEVIFTIFNYFPIITVKQYFKNLYLYKKGDVYTSFNEGSKTSFSDIIYNPSSRLGDLDFTRRLIEMFNGNYLGTKLLPSLNPASSDICSTYSTGLPRFNNESNKVIAADYILAVDINRFATYKLFKRVILNIDDTLTINNFTFSLRSAVCRKFTEEVCFSRLRRLNYYTLVKLEDGRWFKYSKDNYENNLIDLKVKKLLNGINADTSFLNHYNANVGNDADEPITNLTNEIVKQYIGFRGNYNEVLSILNGNINVFQNDYFIIDNATAMKEISTDAVLLIYASNKPVINPCDYTFKCTQNQIL